MCTDSSVSDDFCTYLGMHARLAQGDQDLQRLFVKAGVQYFADLIRNVQSLLGLLGRIHVVAMSNE